MPSIQADLPEERVQRRLSARFFHGHLGHVPLAEGSGGTLYLHGAAMVVDRLKFLELGGFDPLFFYQEDNDISYRAWRKGWHCWFEPLSQVYHMGSQTTGKVHVGHVDRRAIKERASHFFIIKNIQSPWWLLNFFGWSLLKTLKMLATFDLGRAWAWKETFLKLPKLLKSRSLESRISDAEIIQRVEGLS
jgi:GT2 family glycosyltransferase